MDTIKLYIAIYRYLLPYKAGLVNLISTVVDMNENPLNPCQGEIYIAETASNGSVLWTFKERDPDNEEYEIALKRGLKSYHQKQHLVFSLHSNASAMPFMVIGERYLVKTGVCML